MGLIRMFKRDLGSQIAVSRNLEEGASLKCKRLFWASLFVLKGLRTGFRAMRSEQLGSQVVYRGRKCFVTNWADSSAPTLSAEGFYKEYCDRSEIENIRNIREYWHRFSYGVEFYMSNWHGIDVNNRLYPHI